MEYKIKELDMKALQEEILRKCRKKAKFLAPRDDETKEHEAKDLHKKEDVLLMKTDKITEEDLPFEDILAEKRRKYTAKEEFIYSMYNDVLPFFVTEWDGYFLRRKPLAKQLNKANAETIIEEEEETDDKRDNSFMKEGEEEKDKISIPSWKLSLPDEFAKIKFYNKNSYCGRISRKMMESEGTYHWHNGVHYKGQFERNKMQGRGFLEWNNNCWYEGQFMDGFRHGKGLMVDREKNLMCMGQWHLGQKKIK